MLIKYKNGVFFEAKLPIFDKGRLIFTNNEELLKQYNIYKVIQEDTPPQENYESYFEFLDGKVYQRYKILPPQEETDESINYEYEKIIDILTGESQGDDI